MLVGRAGPLSNGGVVKNVVLVSLIKEASLETVRDYPLTAEPQAVVIVSPLTGMPLPVNFVCPLTKSR